MATTNRGTYPHCVMVKIFLGNQFLSPDAQIRDNYNKH